MSESDNTCDNCSRRWTRHELFSDVTTYQGPRWVCSDCYELYELEEEAIEAGMSEEEFRAEQELL